MSAARDNDSSSAASRPEINTVIFNHCVIDGNFSERDNITQPVPEDFKVEMLRKKSIFHKKYKLQKKFRSALFDYIKPMLVDAKVLALNFPYLL